MLVKQGKEIARQWVMERGSQTPGFCGAFFTGSLNWKSDNEDIPSTSDIDIRIVIDGADLPNSVSSFVYHGLLFEVGYSPISQFRSPEAILGDYTLACHFTKPCIIADVSGELTVLKNVISRDFAKHQWIYKRCEHARDWTLASPQWFKDEDPSSDHVLPWLCQIGYACHILLTADLQNPTARKCMVEAKEVLARYGRMDIYDELLKVLGSYNLKREQVEPHLRQLAEVYDVAKEIIRTPFFFAFDINNYARSKSIDGCQQLIDSGYHREAMLWIGFYFSLCQRVLRNDASTEVQKQFYLPYKHFLSDLGIESDSDLHKRSGQNVTLINTIWNVAELMIATNPEIIPD